MIDDFENNEVNKTSTTTQYNTSVDSIVFEGNIVPNNKFLGEPGSPENKNDIRLPSMINLETVILRCSPRILAQDERPKRMVLFTILLIVNNAAAISVSVLNTVSSYATKAIHYMEKVNRICDGIPNFTHQFSFATSLADNKSYTLKEALKQEDTDEFTQIMLKEVDAHEKKKQWTLMKILDIGNN